MYEGGGEWASKEWRRRRTKWPGLPEPAPRASLRRTVCLLDNIRIVLVEPAVPGNVGAVARVLRTTGIAHLTLVNPGDWDTARARWMAHGSQTILDSCQVVGSVAAAVRDVHLVIGTSHRVGRFREVADGYSKVLHRAAGLAHQHQVAILFGREKDGLSREEIEHCHEVIRIPSAVSHPSFNLSHAVLLVAFELFRVADDVPPPRPRDLVSVGDLDHLSERVLQAMSAIDFHPYNEDPSNFRRVVRRVLRRVQLERRDANVIHRVCGQIRKFARRAGPG